MRISAVVLNFNGAEYISRCLESLSRVKHGAYFFDIYVIDNNSWDDSVKLVQNKFPNANLTINQTNLGFAEGNNVGIRLALENKSDFVWIVNPDVYVAPDSLLNLLAGADNYKNAGIFSPKIYFAPGYEFHRDRYAKKDLGRVIWYAGGNIDWNNLIASHRGVDQVDTGKFDHDIETDFVSGACMLIRSRVFSTTGLLDPKYYLYFEENDLCQRARKFGWRLMYICQSVVWHANAQSTGVGSSLQDYYITRNRLLFGLRYAPLRTKLSLVKQSLNLYLSGRPWQRRAVLDYYTNNLGAGSYQS